MILVAVTFIFAGLIKGVIGLGLPTVSLAILTATLGLRDAMALMLIPSLATNIWQAIAGPALGEVVRRFWPMAVATVVGAFIGLSVGITISPHVLAAILGLTLLVYGVSGIAGLVLPAAGKSERVLTPAVGLVSGAMTGLVGVFMVPAVLYLQALRLPKDVFVQSLGFLLSVAAVSLGAALSRFSLFSGEQALLSTAALLPAFAGLYTGQQLRAKLSEDRFRTILFCALAVFGLYLIIRAVV